MRILLDTHVLLWSVAASSRLPRSIRDQLADPQHTVFFSAASIWEIAIKITLRRRSFRVDLDRLLRTLVETDFTELPVTAAHAARVAALPDWHKDPFDRLLIGQALTEPAVLLTNDAQLSAYGDFVRVF